MRNNHRWTRMIRHYSLQLMLSAGTLTSLALALSAGRRWG
jgi:hypothetical protein